MSECHKIYVVAFQKFMNIFEEALKIKKTNELKSCKIKNTGSNEVTFFLISAMLSSCRHQKICRWCNFNFQRIIF